MGRNKKHRGAAQWGGRLRWPPHWVCDLCLCSLISLFYECLWIFFIYSLYIPYIYIHIYSIFPKYCPYVSFVCFVLYSVNRFESNFSIGGVSEGYSFHWKLHVFKEHICLLENVL